MVAKLPAGNKGGGRPSSGLTATPVVEVDDDEFPAFPDLTMPLRAAEGPFATGFEEASLVFPAAAAVVEADEDADAEALEALPMSGVAGFRQKPPRQSSQALSRA